MKKHTLGLSIATILLLAACGGGGSDDNSPADPNSGGSNNNTPSVSKTNTPSTPKPNTPSVSKTNTPSTPKPNTPSAPNNPVSGKYQGTAYIVPVGSQPGQAVNIGTDTLDTPNIGGTQILTRIPGFNVGGFFINRDGKINGKSYKFFIISGNRYASRFGYFNEGNNDYIFSLGERTTNMPTSGSASYSGEGIVGRAANAETATAKITADFGQKTVKGELTQTPSDHSTFTFNPVSFNATINGNSFSGDGAVKSNGNFYGNNAAEVGGIFHDTTQNLYGSFGAKRASN